MQALFVHGMGRSSLSGWPLLRRMRRAGSATATFDYAVRREPFETIVARLGAAIDALPAGGPLILVGHSLGGVLLRAALADEAGRTTRVWRLFLLGSPVAPSRYARRLAKNRLFCAATRDCGALLASAERMSAIPRPAVPTTAIVGIGGPAFARGPFGFEPNDGIVSLSEVSAEWLDDQVRVPIVHGWLPASARVAEVVLARLG